ncbi:erythronate-4-phosphate dehydrogenase [Bacteroides sp. CAG:927]|mgnify:FL=1|jgi:erythronate-4-phosphate dehydrogenase|nr:erythronate-4-phosphate dehydrogenase [Bacteroides sp. CAG:927]
MDLNVIIEANIPYSRSILEPMGVKVRYLAPELITPEAMQDTDALVTRTRTRCDKELLEHSRCSMIASATIGLDHVNTAWCESHGIEVANAPGCNAPAVAQYVFSSIMALKGSDLSQLTLGIIGVGNVGKIVQQWAKSLGMRVLLCDPPRQKAEGGKWNTMDQIAREADIITFHTPLIRDGEYPTYHMCDAAFLDNCARTPVIINAARGAVVDTPALVKALADGKVSHAVIDCWEHEPDISPELLDAAVIATPHIAGYSKQGKIRATHMALDAVARHFHLPQPIFAEPTPGPAPTQVNACEIMLSYNPAADTHALKKSPRLFEQLRNNYNLRTEVGFDTSTKPNKSLS